jgi:hypothetical protein
MIELNARADQVQWLVAPMPPVFVQLYGPLVSFGTLLLRFPLLKVSNNTRLLPYNTYLGRNTL